MTITSRDCLMQFRYKNWHDHEHVYVIEVEGVECGRYANEGAGREFPPAWVVHGSVVTRDGDPRPDIRPSHRRTFVMSEMRDIEAVRPT